MRQSHFHADAACCIRLPSGIEPAVRSAADQGWQELTNGALMKAAEEAGFDAIITADKNIRYQQNLTGRKIALLVLSTNTWQVLRDNAALIVDAVNRVRPGGYEEIGFPRPLLRRRPPNRSS